jgi:hypothetical protein
MMLSVCGDLCAAGRVVSDRGFMSWRAALPIGTAWIRGGGCAARSGTGMNSRYGDLEFEVFFLFALVARCSVRLRLFGVGWEVSGTFIM